jgi:hypothetical protein
MSNPATTAQHGYIHRKDDYLNRLCNNENGRAQGGDVDAVHRARPDGGGFSRDQL